MKIRFLRLIALVLTAAVLLSGCGMVDFGEYFGAVRSLVDGNAIVPYESMTYERPDMTQLQQTLDAACEAAEGRVLRSGQAPRRQCRSPVGTGRRTHVVGCGRWKNASRCRGNRACHPLLWR